MRKVKQRMQSDTGASNTTETILLIALAVFAVLAVFKFIIVPIRDSSKLIGGKIKKMGE